MNNAELKGVTGMSRDLLLKVVANRKRIFSGTEEGTRKYKNDMLLLIDSSKMRELKTWINDEHRKSFKIIEKTDYERSVTEMKQKGKYHEINLAEK